MRAFIISILMLSIAGAAVSALLIYQRYIPQTEFGMPACGGALSNPCRIPARSGFDAVFGFPAAGLGVPVYLFMIVAIAVTMICGHNPFVREALTERIRLLIHEEAEHGSGLIVKAVPAPFINGRRLEGVPDASHLEAVLSEEMETGRR